MNRQIIMLTACGVVALLLCLGGGYFLFDAWSEKSARAEERAQKMSELNAIYTAKVFPCPENQKRLEKDTEAITAWRTATSNLFQRGRLNLGSRLTPSGFKQQLVRDVDLLRSQFRTAQRPGDKDYKFGFDFDPYLGAVLPDSKHVARLALQLEMVNTLCRELKASGVQEICGIEREEFDLSDKDKKSKEQETTSRRRRNRRQTSSASRRTVENTGIKPYASKERFTLSFTARPDVLIKVMNRLASMDLFVTIAEVQILKEQDMFRTFLHKREAQENKRSKDKQLSDEVKNPLDTASKLAVRETVTDSELDSPASVNLIVDVYTF